MPAPCDLCPEPQCDTEFEKTARDRVGSIPNVEEWEFASYAHAYWYGLRHGYHQALRDEA